MTDVGRIRKLKRSAPINAIDIVFISVLVVLTVAFSVFVFLGRNKGSEVKITSSGVTSSYLLDRDREIVLDSLTVVIEGGEVYVKDSKCPDKLCEKMGRVHYVGESIVCLPAGVVVTIEGDGEFQVSTGQEK